MHYPPVDEIIASLSNHELTGVQNWFDLEEVDFADQYKNEFELKSNFPVTKQSIVELYENQLKQLVDYGSERTVQISHSVTEGSMSDNLPTILERFRFAEGGDLAGIFIKAILAQYKRRQWDRQIMDLRLVSSVIDRNMVLLEELATELVPGRSEREVLVKRCIFRHKGCVFVYSSSVPDQVHEDEDSGRDDATRYTLLYQIMCFKKVGTDLVMEQIKQIHFRDGHSERMMEQYLASANLKALYWQQDLLEYVAQESLKN